MAIQEVVFMLASTHVWAYYRIALCGGRVLSRIGFVIVDRQVGGITKNN